MKIARFRHNNKVSVGLVTAKGIIDINKHIPASTNKFDTIELLKKGPDFLSDIETSCKGQVDIGNDENYQLMAPIERPGKTIGLAGNYAKHIAEMARPGDLVKDFRKTTTPRPFLMPSTVITGPDTQVPLPSYSTQIDHEIELAIVIGKDAYCVDSAQAVDCIAGYTIANDISARSVTFKDRRTERPKDNFFDWLCGKWSNGFLPTGPWIVTTDEITDVHDLSMELKVNGQIRQQSNTSQMIYNCAEIVSFISHLMTLEPGDIIATGTPEGVGAGRGEFLNPGDTIQCTIEKIGTLMNRIGNRTAALYTPLQND